MARTRAFVAAVGALTALTTTFACRRSSTTVDIEPACREEQALTTTRYRGPDMPAKTLALTFDDGPGARTLELSRFLAERGVPAAFFVNGRNLHAANSEAILRTLVEDGHVIGNHTETHPDLTTLTPDQIVAEVEATDRILAPFVGGGPFLFRPPFGAYNDATFAALQGSAMAKYVGPIDWDLGWVMGPAEAADWDCWSPRGTSVPPVLDVATCGALYLAQIRAKDHGIVLLHDPYFIDDDPQKGGTVDMIESILPTLIAEGFTFVRIDEVPSIQALTGPPDAGARRDAGRDRTSDAAPPSPTSADREPSGDTSDPCPPSPQQVSPRATESGHLRHP
jgi:peptidoglycan-N-acetylglucosamine deacetylase